MDKEYRYHFALIILMLGLAAACLPSAAAPTIPPPPATATPVILYGEEARPVAEPGGSEPTPTAAATPQSLLDSCPTPPTSDLTYNAQVIIDYTAKTVHVEQEISVTNTTETALDKLVFYVHPNKQPGVFHLEEVTLPSGAEPSQVTLEGVRLEVILHEPQQPNCSQELTLLYRLSVPPMGQGSFPRQGYLGYNHRQFNLGFWLPVLAYFHEDTWLTPQPINVGEQMVTPAADYTVTVEVENAPDDLFVVGPGDVTQEDTTWTFTLPRARDFTLSLSTAYQRLTEQRGTVQVEVYTFANDSTNTSTDQPYNAPAHTLASAGAALELFTDLYGPYPYDRLVILESDFPDGMEFSGLVFVGGEWFRTYRGNPAGYLTLITVHEVAHQWWYNIVGSDQSAHPWLDEAAATYSEYVFLQENYPDLTGWWWEFRVNAYFPEGTVDSTVYEFNTVRGYINAVYLRGAQFLHAIRQEIGTEAFFRWLGDYVDSMRHQIAEPGDLWRVLPVNLQRSTREIRAQYLRQPDIDPDN